MTSLTLSFAEAVRRLLPWIVLPRMDTVPRWIAIVVIIVAMDGCNWAVHLANHRVRMLWRFHELHHSQEDMNVLTVFRTHPLIHVSYLLALLPGLVLLANGALSITVLALYGGIVAFAHSNTRLGFGPLGRIFVSPNFHRIHHKLDGPQDVNLGFALTIWDQLFRTAVFPTAETVRTDTGLPGRPLLVEQATPRSRHLMVYAAQLVAPFRPFRDATIDVVPSGGRPFAPPSTRSPVGGRWPWDGARVPGHSRTLRGGLMVTAVGARRQGSLAGRSWRSSSPLGPQSSRPAVHLLAARIALAWIFVYYGAGKLFGAFNGPGIHRTALYMSEVAHLHPGGFFAVLGGCIEFGGAVALALGLCSRLAGVALFGDQVMAMITVTWATGINSSAPPPGYQLNMALGVLALVVAVLGSGRFSLDAVIERRIGATEAPRDG